MVENAGFRRGAPAGQNHVPSGSCCGTARFASVLRSRCTPRAPAYPKVITVSPAICCWRLMFHTCRLGLSRLYSIGRTDGMELAAKLGRGKLGLAMTGRGVQGGLVTVTIRFCWLFVLKYKP